MVVAGVAVLVAVVVVVAADAPELAVSGAPRAAMLPQEEKLSAP